MQEWASTQRRERDLENRHSGNETFFQSVASGTWRNNSDIAACIHKFRSVLDYVIILISFSCLCFAMYILILSWLCSRPDFALYSGGATVGTSSLRPTSTLTQQQQLPLPSPSSFPQEMVNSLEHMSGQLDILTQVHSTLANLPSSYLPFSNCNNPDYFSRRLQS